MTAGDYTVDLIIGDWSTSINKDDLTDPAADAITMEPLHVEWAMTGAYPSQPTPTSVSFGLYVPDRLVGPTPLQGDRVEITITTPDHNPLSDFDPVLDFVGQITSTNAIPFRDGLRFPIAANDYRNGLGEERIGDEPWPAESRYNRLTRVLGLTEKPVTITPAEDLRMQVSGLGPEVGARDVDSQPTYDLITELLNAGAIWLGMNPGFYLNGYIDRTWRSAGLNTWLRPIISQSVDVAGEVTFPIVFVTGGGPGIDASLPYRVQLVGGVLQLVRKVAGEPTDSTVAWIPATAVESDSVSWRQDKAGNTNRVRLTAPSLIDRGIVKTGSLTESFAELVEANGANEVAISLADETDDYLSATDLIFAQLGTRYDGTPRWAMDTFTIRAEEMSDGDQWPRLFDPREHTDGATDAALGKFVLIMNPASKWNLHDRVDYWGRLTAATFDLEGGRIKWTATLAHRLPTGIGLPVDPLGATSSHHPITYAELGAAANPTIAQCGDLTPADLELVED